MLRVEKKKNRIGSSVQTFDLYWVLIDECFIVIATILKMGTMKGLYRFLKKVDR